MEAYLNQIPKLLQQNVHSQLFQAKDAIQNLKKRLQRIQDGTLKNQLCAWWLSYIETESEEFLKLWGFDSSSIPIISATGEFQTPIESDEKMKKSLEII